MESNSPAKLNLFLHVTGKREDGYHLLESLFVPLKVFDEIRIAQSNNLICHVDGAQIDDNIILKAAKLLQSKYHVNVGAEISIKKNIPIGAGLGGGSSNAATTLKLLNKFWDLKLSDNTLKALGLELGADVPFFINPQPSFIKGVGEIIEPFKSNLKLPILVIFPNAHTSTRDVFEVGFKYSKPISHDEVLANILSGRNDTYINAIKTTPIISQAIEWLGNQQGTKLARMSGTGSACFAIFEDEKSAQASYEQVPNRWWKHYELLSL